MSSEGVRVLRVGKESAADAALVVAPVATNAASAVGKGWRKARRIGLAVSRALTEH